MQKKYISRLILVVFVLAVIVGYKYFDLGQYLTLENLKSNQQGLAAYYNEHTLGFIGIYLLIYILMAALSFPGATVLTLAGGAIFGFWMGTLIVSVASTVGATLAFLGSRFLFKETVQTKFKDKLVKFNEGFQKEGAFYLLTLRLLPIFPFFLINLLMGLTPIRTITYFFVSQIGMLPGTAVYVNAGTQLAQIESLKGILSLPVILSFAVMGILPLLTKIILRFYKNRKLYSKFKKPKKFDYNLVAIGGGSAGLVTAYIAAAVKAKVALIEKHKMGGDCLNTGCVPSKALIRSSKVASLIRRANEFGIDSSIAEVDFSKVMNRVQKVIETIEPHDSMERYESLGVNCVQGEAKILSPYEIQINEKIITTKNIVIATGASPLVPPITGLDKIPFLTSDNLWKLKTKPNRLLILGGGPIGCELAQSFSRLGSEVSLVEMSARILSREDEDVSSLIKKKFIADGVRVLTGHKAKEFKTVEGKKILLADNNGQDVEIEFDEVVVALGRKANVKGFGLEELNVEITDKGTVHVDEYLRTKYHNIYACGDVAGPYQFTHTASHQAWYCAVNALFSPFKKFKVDYRVIPWCTFTDPEVARVGVNEIEAKEQGLAYDVTTYGIDDLDRAIAESEAHGFVKVLTKKGSDKILGVTIVGDHAGEIIIEYVTAMKFNLGLNKILSTIHIYPTFSEANKFAAGQWKKKNAPKSLLRWVEKFHSLNMG